MKFTPPTSLIKAIVVAGIMGLIGWIGFDIPQSVIEETVDQQFESIQSGQNSDLTQVADVPVAAYVTEVIDGDTVRVEIDGQPEMVRLIGINTPETAGSPAGVQCYGDEATSYLRTLAENKAVTLTPDGTQSVRDKYDRLLMYMALGDGRDVGQIMITEGYAEERTYAALYSKQALYQQAEAVAKQTQRGQWSVCQ